jgi:hypothetical protein
MGGAPLLEILRMVTAAERTKRQPAYSVVRNTYLYATSGLEFCAAVEIPRRAALSANLLM